MQIRSETLDTLARESFLARIRTTVRETLPHRVGKTEDDAKRINPLVALGQEYHVTSERALTRFVCLAVICGEQTMRSPEVAAAFQKAAGDENCLVDEMLHGIAAGEK